MTRYPATVAAIVFFAALALIGYLEQVPA